MAEECMSAKHYKKFEKVFYLYGSVSKMVTPVRPDEWQRLAEEMWSWAIIKVSTLVDEYAEPVIETPPVMETSHAVETPPEPMTTKGNPLKQKQITVKTVTQAKSGERNGAPWILSRIVDTDNIAFVTFAGHRYTPGKSYTIQYEETQNGRYVNRNIKEPKEREPGEEEDVPF